MTKEEITAYNHKKLSEIKKRKYCSDIQILFDKYPNLIKVLREIYKYYEKKRKVVYKNKNTFTISARYLNGILREKDIYQAKASANKYLNYLCCLGFFEKVSITPEHMRDIKPIYRNKDFTRSISAFSFRKYNRAVLEQINANARVLLENKISPSKLTNKILKASDIENMAEQIHIDNKDNMKWYEEQFKKMSFFIDKDIETNGYTTKRRIYENMNISKSKVDKIIGTYSSKLNNKYIYKPPCKAEREKYNYKSNKWIYLPRN